MAKKLPWLKLWHEYLDKTKVQILSESLRARHINLLCIACKENADGKLPALKFIAHGLRLSEPESVVTLADLTDAGLVDTRTRDGATSYQIHDWDDWQSRKTPAAVRQKKVRDKRNALRNGDVTEPVTNMVISSVTNCATRALAPTLGSVSVSESQEGSPEGNPPDPGPEFTALGKFAIDLTCDLSMGQWVSRMARLQYTAPMIRYALEEGAAAGNFAHRWLHGILKRVAVEGVPESQYQAPEANGHAVPVADQMSDELKKRLAEWEAKNGSPHG